MIAPISRSCHATCCGLGFTSAKFWANDSVAHSVNMAQTAAVLWNIIFIGPSMIWESKTSSSPLLKYRLAHTFVVRHVAQQTHQLVRSTVDTSVFLEYAHHDAIPAERLSNLDMGCA